MKLQYAHNDESTRYYHKLVVRFHELVPEVVEALQRHAGKSGQEARSLIEPDWRAGLFDD